MAGEVDELEDEELDDAQQKSNKPKETTEPSTQAAGSGEKPDKKRSKETLKVESEAQCRALISEFYQMVVNRSNYVTMKGRMHIQER